MQRYVLDVTRLLTHCDCVLLFRRRTLTLPLEFEILTLVQLFCDRENKIDGW